MQRNDNTPIRDVTPNLRELLYEVAFSKGGRSGIRKKIKARRGKSTSVTS